MGLCRTENLVIFWFIIFVHLNQPTSLSPQTLEFKLRYIPYSRLLIAYSGGIDSHVLLHLCAAIDHLKSKTTAVYVNHGLQAEAESWGKHCGQVCHGLGVNFLSLAVHAEAKPGESPEEAARNARYAALQPLLAKGDVLLVAQHAEDQLETLLLQLFRGSGLKGLAGMPETMAFGEGRLVRPLLDIASAEITDYAKSHGLKWIEDPSNQQTHYDRNFLRNDILPKLKQRWPSLAKTVSRSARHCGNAQDILDTLADSGLTEVMSTQDCSLSIKKLQCYSTAQQALIIRQWFQQQGLKMPSEAVVKRVLTQVVGARVGADPVLATQGITIRRYRDVLCCLKPVGIRPEQALIWPAQARTFEIAKGVVYQIVASSSGIPLSCWQQAQIIVKFRSGSEVLQLPYRSGHHALKKLFQEAAIPPWERRLIPLVYLDGKLAAVGEHWISAEFYSAKQESCIRVIRQKINPKGNDDRADVV